MSTNHAFQTIFIKQLIDHFNFYKNRLLLLCFYLTISIKKMKKNSIKFIDLFAGLGGTRIGFERAVKKLGLIPKCVFTSEIKNHAVNVYSKNFKDNNIKGDITKISAENIPNFDCLLAGFPCQPFSYSGKREGFLDTRGTLFFEIERILRAKRPKIFLLENVEGLVNHDKKNRNDKIGRTLDVILTKLKDLGYYVNWKVLNATDFGVPQERKRIYITGSLIRQANLDNFKKTNKTISDIKESGQPLMITDFTRKLLSHFSTNELIGKAIKDKRGGDSNIHSWDFELKGKVSNTQKDLLNTIFKERRKKKWAVQKNIKWMDGMPLTLEDIFSFYNEKIKTKKELKATLDDLTKKGYLKLEYPKGLVEMRDDNGNIRKKRIQDKAGKLGYNIVTGKLSFEINEILNFDGYAPTLVATDMSKIALIDNDGIRKLTIREGLRLFGFPENYKIDIDENKAYDLLGNSIVVTVVEKVSERILKTLK